MLHLSDRIYWIIISLFVVACDASSTFSVAPIMEAPLTSTSTSTPLVDSVALSSVDSNLTINLSSSPSSQLLDYYVSLSWSASDATSCLASGAWSGTKSTTGSENVLINEVGLNNFTLTCNSASDLSLIHI